MDPIVPTIGCCADCHVREGACSNCADWPCRCCIHVAPCVDCCVAIAESMYFDPS